MFKLYTNLCSKSWFQFSVSFEHYVFVTHNATQKNHPASQSQGQGHKIVTACAIYKGLRNMHTTCEHLHLMY